MDVQEETEGQEQSWAGASGVLWGREEQRSTQADAERRQNRKEIKSEVW